jgi:hypothetical protein
MPAAPAFVQSASWQQNGAATLQLACGMHPAAVPPSAG